MLFPVMLGMSTTARDLIQHAIPHIVELDSMGMGATNRTAMAEAIGEAAGSGLGDMPELCVAEVLLQLGTLEGRRRRGGGKDTSMWDLVKFEGSVSSDHFL